MSADRMPIGRGIAPLADIPVGECRGPPICSDRDGALSSLTARLAERE
jgi:hypothetical protein